MKFDWLPVTRYEQNCSILWCEETRKAAVIDPGGDLDQIRNVLELDQLDLEVVLVTHGHMDHAGGASELAAATGARIEGPHRGDEHMIKRLALDGARFGVPASQPYTPDRWLEHGDEIAFGAVRLQVLHCPGHSKGHVAYFHEQSRQAFVGDILFENAIGEWSYGGNLAQLVASIRSKLFPLGDDVRFLPGHGETSTFGRERAQNPFVSDAAIEQWWADGRRDWPELPRMHRPLG